MSETSEEKVGIENVPIPFNIIGIFMVLIGILLGIMVLFETTGKDQLFTGVMALVIMVIGFLLKLAGNKIKKRRKLLNKSETLN